MKIIKHSFFGILIIFSHTYALNANNTKNKEYSGKKIKITKSIVNYETLIINNSTLEYPHSWAPVSFQVKNLIIKGNQPVKIYGWKLVDIDRIKGNPIKLTIDSKGGIILNTIEHSPQQEIVFGRFSKYIFASFEERSSSKKTKVVIYLSPKFKKKILFLNKNALLDIQCKGKGEGVIFYKGRIDNINVNGNCKIFYITDTAPASKGINDLFIKVDSKDFNQINNKDLWIPDKNIIYVVKYNKLRKVAVAVIFGIDLKANKIIKDIPEAVAKATDYVKKITDNKGNVYYIYSKEPKPGKVIINHKQYLIKTIKVQ